MHPITTHTEPGLARSAPPVDEAPHAQILIVEDESIVALDVRRRLHSLGYAVLAVLESGEEALEAVARLQPQLVLMDIKLRGRMDGVEVAERIRAKFGIPVVFLTAHTDEATLQRAKLTEPFGYIVKPFEERDLAITIGMALHKHRLDRQLKETFERVERAKKEWEATVDAMPDLVCLIDEQGRVLRANRAVESWQLSSVLNVKGVPLHELLHPGCVDPVCPIGAFLSDAANKSLRGESNFWEGQDDILERHLSIRARPVAGPDRAQQRTAVIVASDVTERKRSEEALQRYADELRVRNEELDTFAHTVAHDLKNPLNHIIGYTSLFRRDHVDLSDAELLEGLDIIANSARKMDRILEELLLLASVRQADVRSEQLDMAGLVTEASQRLAYLMAAHQAEIIAPPTWPAALGYGPWIEEVWANYISNAVKYGGRPPRVEMGGELLPDGQARFWVRDNGDGVTSEARERLFTPFTRLDQARANGYGLGLSIVRRIVEKLGGQVGVESDGLPGQGSLFYFTLPAAGALVSSSEC